MISMQKLPICLIFAVFMILIVSPVSGLECYQMSQQAPVQNQWYSCPSTISQCMKFVCAGPNYFINKGCYDMANPNTNCQHLQGVCQGQGGIGTCYTCNRNRCNGASGASFGIGFLLVAALAGLKTIV